VGWAYDKVNEIIHGKRGVAAKSALLLADAFDMESVFWLNLQKNWELWHVQQSHKYIESLAN
jgi:antitoxin HigA-1